jgi:outer membrane protein OmpA-like peptidoglycan-associated protein
MLRSLLLVTVALGCTAAAPAREALTDHPLIQPYEGSTLRRKDVKDFDEYRLITGTNGKALSGPTLEGKVTRLFYANPKGRSVLEVFRNYSDALQRGGATMLFSCDQQKAECLKAYAGPGFQKHSGIQAIRNTIGRFLSAKVEQGGQTAYVAVAVSDIFTDVHVIEIKAMDTGMAALDASVLAEGIDKDGFVVVDQIYFDTDKTSITPASAPAMQQVAKLLAARPQLKLYVVGHTDMQGTLAHNMALSKGRAVAVVDALTTDYGVAAGRLEGHGAGPLAPQATNANDAGRSLNRRVVLVVR